jgi:hypothetical protein
MKFQLFPTPGKKDPILWHYVSPIACLESIVLSQLGYPFYSWVICQVVIWLHVIIAALRLIHMSAYFAGAKAGRREMIRFLTTHKVDVAGLNIPFSFYEEPKE